MVPVLNAIEDCPTLELNVAATGMHLMPEFGLTINEIMKDGFMVEPVDAIFERDDMKSMANFVGQLIVKLIAAVTDARPDILLIFGDRAEMLGASTVGAYLTIPVAHIHGGDLSSTVDGQVRHAITKLSHIHFPATKKSAERILRMGEEAWRVHQVGSPAVDTVLNTTLLNREQLSMKYDLDFTEPVMLVVQHPVTIECDDAARQMKETLEAVSELKKQAIVVYSNADVGGRSMIELIRLYENNPLFRIFQSLPRIDYLSLLKHASVIVGNSSSGLIEAPSFHVPCVNIGTRQYKRERTANVIDARYDKKDIVKAIDKALCDSQFLEKVEKSESLYGDGRSSKRIVQVLSAVQLDEKLLCKQMTY
jgi:UDP-hydrolysing UDP-N-acetyl-D-glucosamine 2-epimerase